MIKVLKQIGSRYRGKEQQIFFLEFVETNGRFYLITEHINSAGKSRSDRKQLELSTHEAGYSYAVTYIQEQLRP